MDIMSLFKFAGKKPTDPKASVFAGSKAQPLASAPMSYAKPPMSVAPMSYAKPPMSVAPKTKPKVTTPDERIRAIQQANDAATAKLKAENGKNVAANVANAFSQAQAVIDARKTNLSRPPSGGGGSWGNDEAVTTIGLPGSQPIKKVDVGRNLPNVTDVLPGPRKATVEAEGRGEQINVTPMPVQTSRRTALRDEVAAQDEAIRQRDAAIAANRQGPRDMEAIEGFGKAALRAPPQIVASMALDASGAKKAATPEGLLQKTVLGSEPIEPMSQQVASFNKKAEAISDRIRPDLKGKSDFASTMGKLPFMIPAGLLFGGVRSLDADVGIGGAGEKAAKEIGEGIAKDAAEQIGKEAAEKLGKETAERLLAEEGQRLAANGIGETAEKTLLKSPEITDGMVEARRQQFLSDAKQGNPGQPEAWYEGQAKNQPMFRNPKEYPWQFESVADKKPMALAVTPPEITEPDLSYQGKGAGSLRRTSDYGMRAHEVTDDMLAKAGGNVTDEARNVIKNIQNNPDAEVTIYRGAPKGAGINNGDWITLDKNLAESFTKSKLGSPFPGYEVQELKVKASDIAPQLSAGKNTIYDFGYFPKPNEQLASEANNYVKQLYGSKQLDDDIAKGLGHRADDGLGDAIRQPDVGITPTEKERVIAGEGGEHTVRPDENIAGIGRSAERGRPEQGQTAVPEPGTGLGGPELGGGSPKQSNLFLPPKAQERGFIQTAKGAEATAPVVAEKVAGSYDPLTNKATLERAVAFAKENPDEAMRIVKSPETKVTADNVALAQVMIQKAQSEGRYQDAIEIIESMAAHATEQGQAIQALSMWGRLTPEGALKYAQRIVDKANAAAAAFKGGMAKIAEKYKITPELAKEITDTAKKVQGLPPGREREIATAQLMDMMYSAVPPTLLHKISTIQTMAQLLNPKTAIRNLIGNSGFAALENVSDVLGTAIDKGIGLATGRRTRALPSLSKQATGFVHGAKLGFEDAIKGVDTAAIGAGKFEMGRRTFRGKVLGNLEKAMNVTLKAPDRAFYEAAYQGEMDNLERLVASGKLDITPEQMVEIAHYEGLRRTFQDDNMIATTLSKFKKLLNGGKEFGMGDVLIKYPKTPGAILARGAEYSPLGCLRAAYEFVAPLVGGKIGRKTFDQRKFVDAMSRATVGSGVFTLGAVLYSNGIMTGSKNDNSTVADLERDMGGGEYKINLSALKRWVMSGFDDKEARTKEGDAMMTYDWAQPTSISASLGVNAAKSIKSKQGGTNVAETMAEGAAGMTDTLVNQPLFTGVRNALNALAYGGSVQSALMNTAKDVPASFVPTLLNQVKQLTDNTGRETYDPTVWQEAMNRVKVKIPGLAQTLPARNKLIGGERETYQGGSNSPFNVLLNPAFVSKIKTSPESKEVLDLFKSTGETKQLPRFAGKKVKLLNQEFVATAQQYADMQKYLGEQTKKTLDAFQASPLWDKLDDDKKVEYLGKQLSVVAKEAKAKTYMEGMGVTLPEQWPEVLKAKIGVAAITKAGKSKTFKAADKESQARVLQAIVDQYDAALKARTASVNAAQ